MGVIRTIAAMLTCSLSIAASPASAQSGTPVKVHNVVLVHGAWADGSSWEKVIPILQAAGMKVTSVQNPLTSLSEAVSATKRVLAQQDGPTILVGHSWSGTLVSETGIDPKVTALVYVAARAPDAGEDFVALSKKFPIPPARVGIQTHEGGLTTLSEDAFLKYFANEVPTKDAKVLFAEQQPTAASLFGEKTSAAAWHTKPSYYVVAKNDHTISPEFERFLARRMNATTIEVDAGHLAMVSQPDVIADMILEAAGMKR